MLQNKFIVYSPSITTGVDFSINTPQDVFIYINGKTISPASSFQQLTRTRNIKNVYFYVNETEPKPGKFTTIEQTKEHFKNICSTHSKLLNLCTTITDDDDDFITLPIMVDVQRFERC